MTDTQRQTNIELLRLVAMFLIVFSHTNLFSLGRPQGAVFTNEFTWNTLRFAAQSVSCIGVNLFVLISGYFSIKPKFRSVSGLLFQVLFFSLICLGFIELFGLLSGQRLVTLGMLGNAFRILTKYNWFISAYLMLVVFAPMLNSFCNTASRVKLGAVILLFFAASTYLGWATRCSKEFNDGFSFVSFVLLYLVGRYLQLHHHGLVNRPARTDAIHFLFYVVLNTAIAVWRRDNPYKMSVFALNNPLGLYGALCFFLFFSKLKLQNSTLNALAKGTFGIFLLQMHPQVMPLFRKMVKYLYANCNHALFSAQMLLLTLVFCLAGLALDRLRRLIWDKLDFPLNGIYLRLKQRLLQRD